MAYAAKPPADLLCPATGMKKCCIKLYDRCPKWINIQGAHPQTGEKLNHWDCADTWVPILLVENSQQQRGTQKAIESFRNEMTKDNREVLALAKTGLIDARLVQ
jgi:hypothetical protein